MKKRTWWLLGGVAVIGGALVHFHRNGRAAASRCCDEVPGGPDKDKCYEDAGIQGGKLELIFNGLYVTTGIRIKPKEQMDVCDLSIVTE